MAIVYTNPTYPWQVSFGGQKAASTQLNYRQMLSEVCQWNPEVDPQVAGRWINNYYRKVIDMRSWYGLKLKGQIAVLGPINAGQVITNFGSPNVEGIGTNWSTAPAGTAGSMVGLQFRTGFTYGYQTITNVSSPTALQLDSPFVGQAGSNLGGYMIVDSYVNFGANIKRLSWATNQQQGWPMICNWPIQTINSWDVWRISLGWSKYLAQRSPSPDGSALWECWPTPFSAQVFPFEAYQQPPDLVLDDDVMVSWIPSDLIVTRATANACLKGGRSSKYYDPTTAQMFIKEFDERVEQAQKADNNLDQQDVSWDYGDEEGSTGFGTGSAYAQSHDV